MFIFISIIFNSLKKSSLIVFLISLTFVCSCTNDNKHQSESVNVDYGEGAMNINGSNNVDIDLNPKRQKDIDTISITSKEILLVKNIGNNHFSLQIELPDYDHSEIDKNILYWINNNLEIEGSVAINDSTRKSNESKEYGRPYNPKYEGDLFDYQNLAEFYSNKHFDIYNDLQLGIDYSITCKKIYESKDVVSFEIVDFFCNYSNMQSYTDYRGATFFKYNGRILNWAMFESSNVKEVVRREVNNQFLKFPNDKYEEFLATSRFKEFTLPINPPYMTKDGLKFLYKKKELSDKEGNEQINCVVPVEDLNVMSSLASML